jgi:peptide chain release factor 3
VDAAVMVLDAAKGIESQTRKLFEVCRLRDIPIITFVNKMDRDGRDPFDLIDEIEKTLALDVSPAGWPIGQGPDLLGVYDMLDPALRMLVDGGDSDLKVTGLDDQEIERLLPPKMVEELREQAGLVQAACPAFDEARFLEGTLTPMFFGSALRDFGVAHLLDGLARYAPPPRSRPADTRTVLPAEERLTGFIFKVQANMDPNHRDRVAFLRVCSGRLEKGMRLAQVRTGKQVPVNAPLFFFAKERQVAEEAWPGDVVGIANHGTLRIGDTLTEGETLNFRGVPSFAPEYLRRARLDDPMLAKKLKRALEQLADEGVVQLFRPLEGSPPVVGVVGLLQLDVLSSRLRTEYGIPAGFEVAPWEILRWITSDNRDAMARFTRAHITDLAEDHDHEMVVMFTSDWRRRRAEEEWPMIRFHAVREQHSLDRDDQ